MPEISPQSLVAVRIGEALGQLDAALAVDLVEGAAEDGLHVGVRVEEGVLVVEGLAQAEFNSVVNLRNLVNLPLLRLWDHNTHCTGPINRSTG